MTVSCISFDSPSVLATSVRPVGPDAGGQVRLRRQEQQNHGMIIKAKMKLFLSRIKCNTLRNECSRNSFSSSYRKIKSFCFWEGESRAQKLSSYKNNSKLGKGGAASFRGVRSFSGLGLRFLCPKT